MSLLSCIHHHRVGSDRLANADLIFALAGRKSRKIYSLELFSQGQAKQLLVSVGRFEIRRFSELAWPVPINLLQLAAPIPPPSRHFFMWTNKSQTEASLISKGRLGTWSEVQALAEWLVTHHEVKSALIVTSDYHAPRVRLCCLALLPKTVEFRVIGVRDNESDLQRESWWRDPSHRANVLSEVAKLLFYWLYFQFRRVNSAGLRSNEDGERLMENRYLNSSPDS